MPIKVYYLDDEKALCENFVNYFDSPQVAATSFSEVNEFVSAVKADPPDLAFIDFRLSGTTGDMVAKMIDPKIPKYLISGDLYIKTNSIFIEILSKPNENKAIRDVIDRYLQTRKLIA